jgi:hypothetical protein
MLYEWNEKLASVNLSRMSRRNRDLSCLVTVTTFILRKKRIVPGQFAMRLRSLLLLLSGLGNTEVCIAFDGTNRYRRSTAWLGPSAFSVLPRLSALFDALPQGVTESRRKILLSRSGPYFRLDRLSGQIEFGATASLVTQLEDTEPAADVIATWLRDERNLALSIWDPKLIQEKGNSVYRLQIMTLQFVTLQLAPWVDVQMKTMTTTPNSAASKTHTQPQQIPIFRLQSVDFDPNVQLLPGLRISAETLGIVIHVAGELQPTPNGKGVSGSIAFSTSGQLPLPLRILPEAVLQAASDRVNDTIVQFATRSFKGGARANYSKFRQGKYSRSSTNEKFNADPGTSNSD